MCFFLSFFFICGFFSVLDMPSILIFLFKIFCFKFQLNLLMQEFSTLQQPFECSAAGVFQPSQFCGAWAGANSRQLSADVVMSAKSGN